MMTFGHWKSSTCLRDFRFDIMTRYIFTTFLPHHCADILIHPSHGFQSVLLALFYPSVDSEQNLLANSPSSRCSPPSTQGCHNRCRTDRSVCSCALRWPWFRSVIIRSCRRGPYWRDMVSCEYDIRAANPQCDVQISSFRQMGWRLPETEPNCRSGTTTLAPLWPR